MQDKATTIGAYFKGLPEDRRKAMTAVRNVINKNIDKKFKEGMQYGVPSWFVPHSVYPAGYHCDPKQPLPFAGIASQKHHMGLHLFCLYCAPSDVERFQREWKATGKKLDMGKSCVRFRKLEDVPLEVVGRAIKRMTLKKFVDHYENVLKKTPSRSRKKTAKKTAKNGVSRKKATAAKTSARAGGRKKVAKKAGSKKKSHTR